MDYNTPGVYVNEVDSGAKPIASVSTSVPGFLGIFPYNAPVDAVAISGKKGEDALTCKLSPSLISTKGAIAVG